MWGISEGGNMTKAFGLIAMLIALYIGMTIYSEGIENAYGGIFAPIESSDRDAAMTTGLTPAAGMADAPSSGVRRVKVTDAVRERVSADLEEGARRRGY
jgi:hypothetical protein